MNILNPFELHIRQQCDRHWLGLGLHDEPSTCMPVVIGDKARSVCVECDQRQCTREFEKIASVVLEVKLVVHLLKRRYS